jgi:Putative Ig domain
VTNTVHRGIWIASLLLLSAGFAACGGGGGGGGGGPPPPATLTITTTTLQDGVIGTAYNQTVAATGGTGARNFTVTAGALPAGLALNAGSGTISGTPTGPAVTSNFTVNVADSGAPQQNDAQALSIAILATSLGRNDTIASATTLTNGSFAASISPSGHPNTVFNPDEDFYRITTTAASTVTVNIDAQVNGSSLDSVIEIVDANGIPLTTCVAPSFNTVCVHDDEVETVVLDSFLQVQVAGATTFFVHVVEWRGDGRPDLLYTIGISGIN